MNAQFVAKKAYEMAYALFRIAAVVRPGFGSHLEDLGSALLRHSTDGNFPEARKSLEAIHYFVRLASDTGMVGPLQLELVIREINGLDLAMAEAERGTVQKAPREADLSGVFSDAPLPTTPVKPVAVSVVREFASVAALPSEEASRIADDEDTPRAFERMAIPERYLRQTPPAKRQGQAPAKPEIEDRQAVILERITSIGNCRLRDIQTVLPNASERTIRYDLQELVLQGKIEKIGQSGPATYYRVRQ